MSIETADTQMLPMLAASSNTFCIGIAHQFMVELASDAKRRTKVVGPDEEQVDTVDRRNLVDCFKRLLCLDHDDNHGCRVNGFTDFSGGERTEPHMRQHTSVGALAQGREFRRTDDLLRLL